MGGVPGGLRGRVILLVLAPVLVLVLVGVRSALAQVDEVRNVAALEQRGGAVLDATAFARFVQIERGRTNVWASHPTTGHREQVVDARRRTDLAESQLQADVARFDVATAATYAAVLADIDRLGSVRTEQDRGRLNRMAAFEGYSAIVGHLADASATTMQTLGIDEDLVRHVAAADVAGRMGEALAQERDLLGGVMARGSIEGVEHDRYVALTAEQDQLRIQFRRAAPSGEMAGRLDRAMDSTTTSLVADGRRQALAGVFGGAVGIDGQAWWEDATALVAAVESVRSDAAAGVLADLGAIGDRAADRRARSLGLVGGALAVAVGEVVLVRMWVRRPLRALAARATEVAERTLPAAVASAAQGRTSGAVAVEKIDWPPGDELHDLAAAFDEVRSTAVRLAAEQARLRANVSEMFASLGRQSGHLVVHQRALIDRVELADLPVAMQAHLHDIDQLAVRMGRNAAALLVLAGSQPKRRFGAPVLVADVVATAIGEVDHNRRIVVGDVAPALVGSQVGEDLAHVLAELIENGVAATPAPAPVTVAGRVAGERYVVSVIDRGRGLPPGVREELNARLDAAAHEELVPAGSLGLYVVNRLARRWNITVGLAEDPAGGTVAHVSLPPALLSTEDTAVPALAAG